MNEEMTDKWNISVVICDTDTVNLEYRINWDIYMYYILHIQVLLECCYI